MSQTPRTRTLDDAARESPASYQGGLTVILGTMGAGKNAVGQAMARAVLLRGGYTAFVQPGDRAGPPLRTPADIEARLGASMAALNAPQDWRRRVLLLAPTTARSGSDVAGLQAASAPRFGPTITSGSFWPAGARELEWHKRMLIVQDYNALWRSEPDLSPGRLRAAAIEKGLNIVLLVDITGGSLEIGRIAEAASPDARTLAALCRTLVRERRIDEEGLGLLERYMPEFLASVEEEAPEAASGLGVSSRAVRVQPSQLPLAEAAHRLLVAVKSSPEKVTLHTLKSPRGVHEDAPVFSLDPGHLVWPPDRLDGPRPANRERPRQVSPREGPPDTQEHLHGELSRG